MRHDDRVRTIGVLLFEDMEELDAIGPWEVFAYWCHRFPEDGYTVCNFSRDGGTVHCAKGLEVVAQHSFADVPALDVLIYPGGRGTRPHLTDDRQLAWVREQRAAVPLMASVCAGSLVYAAAGLLAGHPATTHWASLERLAELDPTIEVRPDDRFVASTGPDGDVVTSAGISAGIDMALYLVARLAGAEREQQVRRGIQYEPQKG